jgi:hypothetical protein
MSVVAAGSVVVKNVPNFALVAGVPAKQIGWVGKAVYKLEVDDDQSTWPQTNIRYKLTNKGLLGAIPLEINRTPTYLRCNRYGLSKPYRS